MSGPIVRSGPSPKYTQNWARAFGEKKPDSTASTAPSEQARTETGQAGQNRAAEE